ncbi:MAG: ParA family protein [Gemmataceae bacterium]
MRKLLIASQKGGVGKTTTSINLAAATALSGARVLLLDADPLSSISASLNLTQHAQRQSLRQSGIDLPGVLVSNVLPGLDVLSPYDDGGCSDEELDSLLALLGTTAFQDCYDALIVDTPPFMGANPAQLVQTCDEFILVMRTEPMAYRTLPAFLELVQRSRGTHAIQMRGILLTLPDGEELGSRWERELRGRFGTRILPEVIPFDEAVGQALLFGQIVTQSHRDSPVGQAYHRLVEVLQLGSDARETIERTSAASALLLASASVKNDQVGRRPVERPLPPRAPSAVAALLPHSREETPAPPTRPAPPARPTREEFEPPVRRRPRPAPAMANHEEEVEELAPVPAPMPGPVPAHRRPVPAPVAPPVAAPVAPTPPFPLTQGVLFFGLSIFIGVGLRFVELPDWMIPMLVGVAVGAIVILVMLYVVPQETAAAAPLPAPPVAPPGSGRRSGSHRLSGLNRRVPMRKNNDLRDI